MIRVATAAFRLAQRPHSYRWLSSAAASPTSSPAVITEDDNSHTVPEADLQRLSKLRNIGISAHIDSGKTTLTERILYYTGRIDEIHDVRGRDGVGAKMDSLELEREKGITIQSAATFTTWCDTHINIIDTPGHVDFTIEVERALRVLDGAVMVLCSVGGVQSQTCTVDRQMRRYNVPRLSFINKMDRMGANPWRVIDQIRKKLNIGAAAVQIPIGSEDQFNGVVDLVRWRAVYNTGERGEIVEYADIPAELKSEAEMRRRELVETLADYDDQLADIFLAEQEPTTEQLMAAIRRATLSLQFTPVFMGSAFKNKSVQPLLDGVVDFLPHPDERPNTALDIANKERQVQLVPSSQLPLVSLAFKLEDTKYGQLTYVRVYQGQLRRGMLLQNTRNPGKRVKLSKLVRMHSNEMEEVEELGAGEIGAMFGLECASGDSFTDGQLHWAMTSMFVPDPVISLAIRPKTKDNPNFGKALQKFMKEDPTFRVHLDPESRETIISGMGELHLDIYVERMRREYSCECVTGKPQVAYRETITERTPFTYTHKKQSGGSGQYGKVVGYIEPIFPQPPVDSEDGKDIVAAASQSEERNYMVENEFSDQTIGINIPSQFIPSIGKGFQEACEKGRLIGHKVKGVRFVLEDGQAHSVDSSDMAFRLAAAGAFNEAYAKSNPIVLEPIMAVQVTAPQEFQSNLLSQINRRHGVINDSEVRDGYATVNAQIPLNQMFGYSSDLRSASQGKGEFSMEYKCHQPVLRSDQEDMVKAYQKRFSTAAQK